MPPKRKSTRISGLRTSNTTLLNTVAAQPAFKVQKGKAASVPDNKLKRYVESVGTTSKDTGESSQQHSYSEPQEAEEQVQEKGQPSTAVTVTIDKALLEKLIDTQMLVLRGQQDLKEEMKNHRTELASLRADISKMDERMAQVETTTNSTQQELSSVPTCVANAVHSGTHDLRQTIEESKAKAIATKTQALVRTIQNTTVTSSELDTLQDNFYSRSDQVYSRTKARLAEIETKVEKVDNAILKLHHPPDPHRKIVDHVFARLEPKVAHFMNSCAEVKRERESPQSKLNVKRESMSGFRVAKTVPVFKPLKRH